MATKEQVIRLNRNYPNLSSMDIAERLECSAAYVRATARRNGLVLPVRYPTLRAGQLRRQQARLLRQEA